MTFFSSCANNPNNYNLEKESKNFLTWKKIREYQAEQERRAKEAEKHAEADIPINNYLLPDDSILIKFEGDYLWDKRNGGTLRVSKINETDRVLISYTGSFNYENYTIEVIQQGDQKTIIFETPFYVGNYYGYDFNLANFPLGTYWIKIRARSPKLAYEYQYVINLRVEDWR